MGIEYFTQSQVPRRDFAYADIRANAKIGAPMVPVNGKGRSVTVVGPGPSLRDAELPNTDEVWGCNTGLDYLVDHGLRATHGIVLDASETMVDELDRTFDVTYRIASSVCPNFPAYLKAQGRSFEFFHSFIGLAQPKGWNATKRGMPYEEYLYKTAYPKGLIASYGMNCGTRAVFLALLMGFDHVVALGMDSACASGGGMMPDSEDPDYPAWLDGLTLYADGRTPRWQGDNPMMLEGEINGRIWHTTMDMVLSAQCLVQMAKAFPSRVEIVGDTLPNAILDKDPAFFETLPAIVNGSAGVVTGFHAYHAAVA